MNLLEAILLSLVACGSQQGQGLNAPMVHSSGPMILAAPDRIESPPVVEVVEAISVSPGLDTDLELLTITADVVDSRHEVEAIRSYLLDEQAVVDGKAPKGFVPDLAVYSNMPAPRPLYADGPPILVPTPIR